MADIPVPSISTATPAAADTVLGVQGGAVKRFTVGEVGDVARDYTGGKGVFFRVKGADLSPQARNFNFLVRNAPGVNADGRDNNAVSIGWNVGLDAAREDDTEGAFRIGFEEHYIQGGITVFEYHVECTDTSGGTHRVYSCLAPKDGGAGSVAIHAADAHSFNDYSNTQRIKFDFSAGVISFPGDPVITRYMSNNAVFVQQINAAQDSYIGLPYINADDRLFSAHAKGVAFSGATPTTGSYANRFAVIHASSLPANGVLLQQYLPNVTGHAFATRSEGAITGDLKNYLLNNGTGNAIEIISAMAAGGDPVLKLEVSGGAAWHVGVDNSADDDLTIGTGMPGSNNRLRVSTAGHVSIPTVGTGLRIAEGSNAKQGVATLVAGAVTVSNTSVTANSRIFLTSQSDGGTPGFLRVSARTPGTSFTITSSSGADTSVVAYQIFEPA